MAEANPAPRRVSSSRPTWWLLALGLVAVAAVAWPYQAVETGRFVILGLLSVAPLVVPGVLISAWVTASGAGGHIAQAFEGRVVHTIVIASAIGAVTPVCGVTVLPLMAGLLAAGVPFAPIMAFWLSSPVTDPAMFAATAATLGWSFAIGKSVAAFGLGIFGGGVTALISSPAWTKNPLRSNELVMGISSTCGCAPQRFRLDIWKEEGRRAAFRRELLGLTRLLLICLVPAFAGEHALHGLLQPEALTGYVGTGTWWAVPLAVFVGAPAYIDGYAALPLVRGLMDHGMSPGAAMAFLVSGSVVSIWGAMAILPVLRMRPFLLYLGLAVLGSLVSGWLYEFAVS